jgi:hypothetical protein
VVRATTRLILWILQVRILSLAMLNQIFISNSKDNMPIGSTKYNLLLSSKVKSLFPIDLNLILKYITNILIILLLFAIRYYIIIPNINSLDCNSYFFKLYLPLSIVFLLFFKHNVFNINIREMSYKMEGEDKNSPNNKNPNKFLRNFCDNFILFMHSVVVKRKNPTSILILVMLPMILFQSFLMLKIYITVLFISAIFCDICHIFPVIGNPVCQWLKRYATPAIFKLMGNPAGTLIGAAKTLATKAVATPAAKAVGAALIVDYGLSTTGMHQLLGHAIQDTYNGKRSEYHHNPILNRQPMIDNLFYGFGKPPKL